MTINYLKKGSIRDDYMFTEKSIGSGTLWKIIFYRY